MTEQSTNSELIDPRVKAARIKTELAQAQQATAEARKAEVEANAATLAAQRPITKGSGIAGDVTFGEGAGQYIEVLAYEALEQASEEVVQRLHNHSEPGEVTLVMDDKLSQKAQLLAIAHARLNHGIARLKSLTELELPVVKGSKGSVEVPSGEEHLAEEMAKRSVAPTSAGLAFTAGKAVLGSSKTALETASSFLNAAKDLASFFRADLEISGRDTQVTENAVLATVSGQLLAPKKRHKDAEASESAWVPVLPSTSLESTDLLEKVETLMCHRRQLADHRRKLLWSLHPDIVELSQARTQLAEEKSALASTLPQDRGTLTKLEASISSLESKAAELEAKVKIWDHTAAEIDTALAAADALTSTLLNSTEGKPSPVEMLAPLERMEESPGTTLRLEISSQGGENHAVKGPFRTRLVYLGAVTLTYLLTDKDGKVKASGVVTRVATRLTRVGSTARRLRIPHRPWWLRALYGPGSRSAP